MSDDDLLAEQNRELLDTALGGLGLPVRTVNCLEAHGILTLRHLVRKTKEELLAIPNFGEKTLEECHNLADRHDVPHPPWLSRAALFRKSK